MGSVSDPVAAPRPTHARLDIRTHSHDVEEALRREEEALLAAAAALDGGDAPSKQYQQQHQQPRRSASSDRCVNWHILDLALADHITASSFP